MTKLSLISLFQIILNRKSTLRFLLGTIFSLSFSVAVILATIGLMDGYGDTLKSALAKTNGDIIFKARNGFYTDSFINKDLAELSEVAFSTHTLEVEAIALVGGESRGVLLKGVEPESFGKVTGLALKLASDQIAIGKQLAKKYKLKIGDDITLAFNAKKIKSLGSAILKQFSIGAVVSHGLYEKDLRFIYIPKNTLVDTMDYISETSNRGLIKLKEGVVLETFLEQLRIRHPIDFQFKSYWSEHEVLLDAVEIERDTISTALQLIVLVSVINIIAFMVYISEIKAQDIFMLRALGLSMKTFRVFWFWVLTLIWVTSGLVALVFIELIDRILLKLPFLQLPGDIYKLSDLKILLTQNDYLVVYGLSLVWIFTVGYLTLRKIQKRSLISGLRQEFS